jgi:hypothetical protein
MPGVGIGATAIGAIGCGGVAGSGAGATGAGGGATVAIVIGDGIAACSIMPPHDASAVIAGTTANKRNRRIDPRGRKSPRIH